MNVETVRNWFSVLLQNEFNSGYIAGLAAALLIIVIFLLLRLFFTIRFRTRSTRTLTVPSPTGDVVIESEVLIAAVGAIVRQFPALSVREVKLSQRSRGKRYFLELGCGFDAQAGEKFPDLVEKAKNALFSGLAEMFDIRNLSRIKIRLSDYTPAESPTPAEIAMGQKLTPDGKLKFPSTPAADVSSDDLPEGGF